jgi:hypothetical protein
MLRLARKNRILWVNSIGNRNPSASVRDLKRVLTKIQAFGGGCRKVADNIHTLSPLAIPFHGNAAARALNRHFLAWSVRRACRRLGFKNPITWSFLPTSGEVVGNLGEKLIVYHCVDEFWNGICCERRIKCWFHQGLSTKPKSFSTREHRW